MKPTTVGIIVLVVIITILSTINTHNITINLIFWKPDVSLIVLVYCMLITGFLAGYLTKGVSGYRRRKKSGINKTENDK